jgi:hypothetical protein
MKLLTELLALSEDWGSSDWKPVMDAMDRLAASDRYRCSWNKHSVIWHVHHVFIGLRDGLMNSYYRIKQ